MQNELNPPVVPEDVGCVLVMGGSGTYGAWGKGRTEDEAKRNARRNGAKLSLGYTVYTFDQVTEFMGVNGMGSVSWRVIDGSNVHDHDPAEREVKPKAKA